MIIIAVVQQKGGAGKSTLTRGLAVLALQSGLRSAIVDTDEQATSLMWAHERQAAGIPAPAVVALGEQRHADLYEHLRRRGADVLFVDTPPHARPAISLAVTHATGVLIPVQPSPDDLKAMGATLDIVRPTGKPAGIVLNRAKPRTAGFRAAVEALERSGIPLCPAVLQDRMEHQYASAAGLTATESAPASKAADELAAVWEWVKQHVCRETV